MKPNFAIFSVAILAMFSFVSNDAFGDLVAGWNSFPTDGNRIASQAPQDVAAGFSGNLGRSVDGSAANQGGGLNATLGNDFTASTNYGSSFAIVNAGAASGITLNTFSNNNRFVDFSVTNSSGADLNLEGIHFDAGMSFNNDANESREVVVSHFSSVSDLSDAFANRNLGSTGAIAGGNFNYLDYDVDLTTSGLVDLVLADSETAAFRIFIDNATATYGFRVDNIAISGSFAAVPEPASAVLLSLALLAVSSQRRRTME